MDQSGSIQQSKNIKSQSTIINRPEVKYEQEDQESIFSKRKYHQTNDKYFKKHLLKGNLNITTIAILILFFLLFSTFLFVLSSGKTKEQSNSIERDAQINSVFFINNQQDFAVQSLISYLNSIWFYKAQQKGRLLFGDILVGYDKKFTDKSLQQIDKQIKKINEIINKPIKLIWIKKDKQSDIELVDKLLRLVPAQYFFFSTTQYIYLTERKNQNCIEYLEVSQDILSFQPNVSQLVLNISNQIKENKISFSFSPALHRAKDYRLLEKSFKDISGVSQKLTEAQKNISDYYKNKGQYIRLVSKKFTIFKKQNIYSSENQNITLSTNIVINRTLLSNLALFLKPTSKMIFNQSLIPNQTQKPFWRWVHQFQRKIKDPRIYYQFEKLKQMKQLPFCVVVIPSSKHPQHILLNSIKQQNYTNYITILGSTQQSNYYYYYYRIKNECLQNSLIIFIRSPLVPSAFSYINKQHQTYWTYISISITQELIQIHTFYFRIYQLLATNDFSNSNTRYLKQNNILLQALGLLEISAYYVLQLDKSQIMMPKYPTHFYVSKNNVSFVQRTAYNSIYRLSQDILAQTYQFKDPYEGQAKIHIRRSAQRQQVWYLPQNHTILQIQRIQLDESYNISKFKDKSRQVRFCLIVLSHNNIQFNRYQKVLKSIVQQKYDNYHIVFIDDNSTDNNMNASIQYMNSIKFPKDRIKYIQNLKRNYATYNFVNAAFNFCGQNDVEMLMDGDDQFIGKYAMQVLNSAYQLQQKQNQNIWVAYSNYKDNAFSIGRSRPLEQNLTYTKRYMISVFGPIRTWRVKVMYNIPPNYHKQQNGEWLMTLYDEASFYSFLQLSSVKRIKAIPAVLYEYNIGYGDNDNSSQQKLSNRWNNHMYVLTLNPLARLEQLSGIKNQKVMEQLNKDRNVRYKVIQI